MPEPAPPNVTPELIQQMATQIVGVSLSDAELAGFLPLLTAVLGEIAAALALDRSGLEPDLRFVLEEWTS